MDLYMESLAEGLFPEQGVDEGSYMNYWETSSLSDQTRSEDLTSVLGGDIQQLGGDMQQLNSSDGCKFSSPFYSLRSPSSNTFSCSLMECVVSTERPTKIQKSVRWNSHATTGRFGHNSALNTLPAAILQFQKHSSNVEKENLVSQASERNNKAITTQAQDHIIAERRRREKLSQRFIELSAVIPGLTKTDKASVLSDALKHVKELQEKVKKLEENIKSPVEPTVCIKKSQIVADDENSSICSDGNSNQRASSSTPMKLEVKVLERTALVRIQCENRKGVLIRVLTEMEKLTLTIINASVIPFPGTSFDISVTAQIDEELPMTESELAKKLSSAFNQFM